MLSDDKKEKLQQRIAEWGAAEHVPEEVQEKVYILGCQDPVDENDLKTVCDTALLSYKVIDWYMKFVAYLESTQTVKTPDPLTEEMVAIRNAIEALTKALEVLQRRNNG